jgi:hypothetical protein
MSHMPKLYGASVISDDDVRAIISLLTMTMKDRTAYVHVPWINELTPEDHFDFIIVANLEHISMVRKHYVTHMLTPPPIIHFVRPAQREEIDYESAFPTLKIFPIEYAPLDDTDKTIQYDSFYQALSELEKAKTGQPE